MEDNINEINDNFYEFGFELQDLSESLNDFWIKNQLLIEKCQQIKTKVDKFKKYVDIAKVGGTGVSAVGGVALVSGVVLTPFTGGVSGLLCISGGIATAVGSITTIGSEATDSLKSRTFCTELRTLAEQRDRAAQDLNVKFSRFDKFLANLLNKENFNRRLNDNRFEDNNNFANLVSFLAKGSKNAFDLGYKSIKMMESIKDLKTMKSINVAKNVSKVSSNANLAKNVGKTAVSLAPTEIKGINSALVRTTGAGAGKLAFSGVSAAAGLVFTAVDVVNLVKDWNKTHPTIDVINHLIEDLEKDLVTIQRINAFITGAYSNDQIDEELIREIMSCVKNSTDSDTVPKEVQINCN